MVDLARETGIRCVRLPGSRRRGPLGAGVRLLAGRLRRRVAAAGLVTTGDYAGLDEAGHLDGDRFAAAVRRLEQASVR